MHNNLELFAYNISTQMHQDIELQCILYLPNLQLGKYIIIKENLLKAFTADFMQVETKAYRWRHWKTN